jgi:DNA-binding XRE family transcriptional regulator
MKRKTKPLLELLNKELGPMSFVGFLRGARASKDLSQAQMAKMLGLSRSTLCDIEKGRHLVSPGLAAKIARKCGFAATLAVRAALQDQLNKAKLKMRVELLSA